MISLEVEQHISFSKIEQNNGMFPNATQAYRENLSLHARV